MHANVFHCYVLLCVVFAGNAQELQKPHFQIDHKAGKLDIKASKESADIEFTNDNIDLLLKTGDVKRPAVIVSDMFKKGKDKSRDNIHEVPETKSTDDDKLDAKSDVINAGNLNKTISGTVLDSDSNTKETKSIEDKLDAISKVLNADNKTIDGAVLNSDNNSIKNITWKGRIENHSADSHVLDTLQELKSMMMEGSFPAAQTERFHTENATEAIKDETLLQANEIIEKVEYAHGGAQNASAYEERHPEDFKYVAKAQNILKTFHEDETLKKKEETATVAKNKTMAINLTPDSLHKSEISKFIGETFGFDTAAPEEEKKKLVENGSLAHNSSEVNSTEPKASTEEENNLQNLTKISENTHKNNETIEPEEDDEKTPNNNITSRNETSSDSNKENESDISKSELKESNLTTSLKEAVEEREEVDENQRRENPENKSNTTLNGKVLQPKINKNIKDANEDSKNKSDDANFMESKVHKTNKTLSMVKNETEYTLDNLKNSTVVAKEGDDEKNIDMDLEQVQKASELLYKELSKIENGTTELTNNTVNVTAEHEAYSSVDNDVTREATLGLGPQVHAASAKNFTEGVAASSLIKAEQRIDNSQHVTNSSDEKSEKKNTIVPWVPARIQPSSKKGKNEIQDGTIENEMLKSFFKNYLNHRRNNIAGKTNKRSKHKKRPYSNKELKQLESEIEKFERSHASSKKRTKGTTPYTKKELKQLESRIEQFEKRTKKRNADKHASGSKREKVASKKKSSTNKRQKTKLDMEVKNAVEELESLMKEKNRLKENGNNKRNMIERLYRTIYTGNQQDKHKKEPISSWFKTSPKETDADYYAPTAKNIIRSDILKGESPDGQAEKATNGYTRSKAERLDAVEIALLKKVTRAKDLLTKTFLSKKNVTLDSLEGQTDSLLMNKYSKQNAVLTSRLHNLTHEAGNDLDDDNEEEKVFTNENKAIARNLVQTANDIYSKDKQKMNAAIKTKSFLDSSEGPEVNTASNELKHMIEMADQPPLRDVETESIRARNASFNLENEMAMEPSPYERKNTTAERQEQESDYSDEQLDDDDKEYSSKNTVINNASSDDKHEQSDTTLPKEEISSENSKEIEHPSVTDVSTKAESPEKSNVTVKGSQETSATADNSDSSKKSNDTVKNAQETSATADNADSSKKSNDTVKSAQETFSTSDSTNFSNKSNDTVQSTQETSATTDNSNSTLSNSTNRSESADSTLNETKIEIVDGKQEDKDTNDDDNDEEKKKKDGDPKKTNSSQNVEAEKPAAKVQATADSDRGRKENENVEGPEELGFGLAKNDTFQNALSNKQNVSISGKEELTATNTALATNDKTNKSSAEKIDENKSENYDNSKSTKENGAQSLKEEENSHLDKEESNGDKTKEKQLADKDGENVDKKAFTVVKMIPAGNLGFDLSQKTKDNEPHGVIFPGVNRFPDKEVTVEKEQSQITKGNEHHGAIFPGVNRFPDKEVTVEKEQSQITKGNEHHGAIFPGVNKFPDREDTAGKEQSEAMEVNKFPAKEVTAGQEQSDEDKELLKKTKQYEEPSSEKELKKTVASINEGPGSSNKEGGTMSDKELLKKTKEYEKPAPEKTDIKGSSKEIYPKIKDKNAAENKISSNSKAEKGKDQLQSERLKNIVKELKDSLSVQEKKLERKHRKSEKKPTKASKNEQSITKDVLEKQINERVSKKLKTNKENAKVLLKAYKVLKAYKSLLTKTKSKTMENLKKEEDIQAFTGLNKKVTSTDGLNNQATVVPENQSTIKAKELLAQANKDGDQEAEKEKTKELLEQANKDGDQEADKEKTKELLAQANKDGDQEADEKKTKDQEEASLNFKGKTFDTEEASLVSIERDEEERFRQAQSRLQKEQILKDSEFDETLKEEQASSRKKISSYEKLPVKLKEEKAYGRDKTSLNRKDTKEEPSDDNKKNISIKSEGDVKNSDEAEQTSLNSEDSSSKENKSEETLTTSKNSESEEKTTPTKQSTSYEEKHLLKSEDSKDGQSEENSTTTKTENHEKQAASDKEKKANEEKTLLNSEESNSKEGKSEENSAPTKNEKSEEKTAVSNKEVKSDEEKHLLKSANSSSKESKAAEASISSKNEESEEQTTTNKEDGSEKEKTLLNSSSKAVKDNSTTSENDKSEEKSTSSITGEKFDDKQTPDAEKSAEKSEKSSPSMKEGKADDDQKTLGDNKVTEKNIEKGDKDSKNKAEKYDPYTSFRRSKLLTRP